MRDSRCFRNNVEPSMYFVTGTKSQFSHPVGVFVIGDFFFLSLSQLGQWTQLSQLSAVAVEN